MEEQVPTSEFLSLIENESINNNELNNTVDQQIPSFIDFLINNIGGEPRQNIENNSIEHAINSQEKKINYEFDIHTLYYTFSERLKSYKYWPKNYYIRPKELANAGFFYIGIGDYVKCVCCDLVIHDWEQNDNPILEHIRRANETDDGCEYVKIFLDCDEYNFEEPCDEKSKRKKHRKP